MLPTESRIVGLRFRVTCSENATSIRPSRLFNNGGSAAAKSGIKPFCMRPLVSVKPPLQDREAGAKFQVGRQVKASCGWGSRLYRRADIPRTYGKHRIGSWLVY